MDQEIKEALRSVLKEELAPIHKRLNSLESDVKEIESDVKEIRVSQDKMKDNLINGLGPYFEKISEHIDSGTNEVKQILNEHQSVIDTLSARSIKHESEIKDFKHMLKNQ